MPLIIQGDIHDLLNINKYNGSIKEDGGYLSVGMPYPYLVIHTKLSATVINNLSMVCYEKLRKCDRLIIGN